MTRAALGLLIAFADRGFAPRTILDIPSFKMVGDEARGVIISQTVPSPNDAGFALAR